jgi:hypothetical protein
MIVSVFKTDTSTNVWQGKFEKLAYSNPLVIDNLIDSWY